MFISRIRIPSASVLQIILALTTVIALAAPAGADNWPQWRGPFLNGSTSEKNLPSTWSKTKNVLWVAKMPGTGQSTPIIWADRVLITAIEDESKKMWAICLNRFDGSELWKHDMGEGFLSRAGNSGASPSPITDGERVYFLFGTTELATLDMDGKPLWRRNIEEDHGWMQFNFHYGASPLLYQDKLYISVLHRHSAVEVRPEEPRPMSYLLCIDPKTGEDLWKHERDTDAIEESMEAYTTPYPFEGKNGSLIIVAGGDYITAHDPADGKEVWRSHNLNPQNRKNYRLVPSVVSIDETLVFCEPRGQAIFAIKSGGSGQLSEEDLLWSTRENAPDVCTPVIMDGKLFVLDGNRKVMSCLDPATGEVYWSGKLDVNDRFQASPTGADGKIYCISMGGEAVVLSAGDKFEALSKIDMSGEGTCRSTISAAHGQLFVRTEANLYCIESKAE